VARKDWAPTTWAGAIVKGLSQAEEMQTRSLQNQILKEELKALKIKNQNSRRKTSRRVSTPSNTVKPRRKISWPIKQGKFLSGFGPSNKVFNDGIDISTNIGTPIYAAANGHVIFSSFFSKNYENTVIVKGDKGFFFVYSNLKSISVNKGDKISKGGKIAESNDFFHFEVRMKDKNGRSLALDPIPLLNKDSTRKPRYRVSNNMSHIF